MKRIVVKTETRDKTTKTNAHLREGYIPAVMYDQKGNTQNLKMKSNLAEKFVSDIRGTPLVDLSVDGKDTHIALLKEVQTDKRRNVPSHLSFMILDPKKKAMFDIEIFMINESPAIKNSLGILLITRNSVELRGLPEHIPTHLEADITKLEEVGDTILVSDLTIPGELEFINESITELPVATIQPFQKAEEEETPETAETDEDGEPLIDEETGEPIEPEEGAEDGAEGAEGAEGDPDNAKGESEPKKESKGRNE